jgi:hypothetical protein
LQQRLLVQAGRGVRRGRRRRRRRRRRVEQEFEGCCT